MEIDYPLLLDGGLSNVLEANGCDLDHKLWTAALLDENPAAIVDAHVAYLAAGARCITTSGYQASIQGLIDLGHDLDSAERLIGKPVELARKAIEQFLTTAKVSYHPLIAASIGPYGAYLGDGSEYRGDYELSNDELRAFHERRVHLLDTSSADLLALETIPSLQEAQVLAAILHDCDKPSWVSFSCCDSEHLNDGALVSEAAEIFSDTPSVLAIGVNCTAPQYVSGIIECISKAAPEKKIVVYPNSGEIFDAESKSWSGVSEPSAFASQAMRWIEEGADIIGGCCRIGPQHIRDLATMLNAPADSK